MDTTNGIPDSEGPEDVLRRRGTNAQPRSALETQPTVPVYRSPKALIPNTPLAAATISFLLGSLCITGLFIFSNQSLQYGVITNQLGFFIAAWSAFHWGEFAVTAGWNREKCSVDSFLLENGSTYHIAHSIAILEHVVTVWFKPASKTYPYVSVVVGQALRSIAMIHAATNFSHAVAYNKLDTHVLVTDGIYSWFRHPSYAGFFYWALGTQLVLQNPVSLIIYSALLWKFFRDRIRYEEQALVRFFGRAYVDYRSRVGTKIPFIA
ncbi:prenyl cysteine carboxyl methyltransferase Ste14 [Trametopsis cervina]|nr:prenyl cysteine carboxyl methyltransferase Ste14 [Trametopsis cervina]